jgi:tetratricopeptide (TPR) repeat protein
MGKTALAAEALALWEGRFEWVLLYQAKPVLSLDATLRDIHAKLKGEDGRYAKYIAKHGADAIYREANAEFTGHDRFVRLTRNLIRALKDEPILIVLDNFEENLRPGTTECADPEWASTLAALAAGLVGSPSRVLITCRRPLAALAGEAAHHVLLGPLPPAEAALYLREQPALSRMIFGDDHVERALAYRLLNASRFHPLLMDRLARLAGGPENRARLLDALEALEKTKDFSTLPSLFATDADDKKTLAYLADALKVSLDHLIQNISPDARRLLWVVGTANQPETLGLVHGVWSGVDPKVEQLRQIKQMLDNPHLLKPEGQAMLNKLATPEFRAKLDALPPAGVPKPDLMPLLRELVSVGLVTEERTEADDKNPNLACHELVRERIRAWMEQKAQDRADMSADSIRLAYAAWLEGTFKAMMHQDMTTALKAGSRALVYCVEAKAWDRLGSFASDVVTSARDPQQLAALVPYLEDAANSAPAGEPRWYCLCYLADALRLGGHPDESLRHYEQAGGEARAVAEAGGEDSRNDWGAFAAISGNWANALLAVGQLDAARQRQLDSAEASKNAGRPAIHVVGSELEALRIDIMQANAAEALPQIESRLTQVEAWWKMQQSGQPVPEAPDAESLARAYVGALDIAKDAHVAQKDWPAALRRIDAIIEVKRALKRPEEDITDTRMNRAIVLGRISDFAKAKTELEACLTIFQNDPTRSSRVLNSLAALFDGQGDIPQAIAQERRALARLEILPDPSNRASSHNNLATYLERSGTTPELAESHSHQLAALIYRLVAGLGQHLQTSLHNYVIDFRRAQAAGTELVVPRVGELLATPAFAPLASWLTQRGVPLDALQAAVDQFLADAREAAATHAAAENNAPPTEPDATPE